MRTKSALYDRFLIYVAKHIDDEERIKSISDTVNDLLPSFIRKNFDSNFTSLYDVRDTSVLKSYAERIILDPVLKAEDASINDVGYVAALTMYRRFMKTAEYQQALQAESSDGSADAFANDGSKGRTADGKTLVEGEILQGEHYDKRERNPKAREACIAYFRKKHHGHVVCECCGFDFGIAYGEMGKDFIEVHHRFPLSKTNGEHEVDPETELVPLCSNCHSMIHRLAAKPGDCISLEELKRRYKGKIYHDQD